VLVDEAQDLSALNHATLRKMCKQRVIAVGDSRQAIYGFRGAHEDSMSLLASQFSMRELSLSITFRCPVAVVEHVRWRAPHIQAPDWAETGSVTSLAAWSACDLPDFAAVLCRNNAPLFSLAIKLLKAGRHVEVGNADIAKGLLKIMRKFGERSLPQASVLLAIDAWMLKEKGKNKKRAHAGIEDRADCMRLFATQGTNLADAIAYAEHLCASIGPLKLLTGHKAKGLEFDHVYFLDQELVGPNEQDPNLRYVIQTRAKKTLTYIRSRDYVEAGMVPPVSGVAIPSPA
jgi:superfamily I DNA/RNA helicase